MLAKLKMVNLMDKAFNMKAFKIYYVFVGVVGLVVFANILIKQI